MRIVPHFHIDYKHQHTKHKDSQSNKSMVSHRALTDKQTAVANIHRLCDTKTQQPIDNQNIDR